MYVSVLQGIRPYDRRWLSQDIVAGITLAALAIPEVMGYTKIAGMPVITGLYTILIPIVAFAVFGSSRHLVVGADSATAAIMYAGIAALGVAGLQPASPQWVALAGLSALLTGALLWVARAARLGFLADFLSRTVLVGFLTGVGVQVAIGQVGGMLGIPGQTSELAFFSGDLVKFLKTLGHVGEASWQTHIGVPMRPGRLGGLRAVDQGRPGRTGRGGRVDHRKLGVHLSVAQHLDPRSGAQRPTERRDAQRRDLERCCRVAAGRGVHARLDRRGRAERSPADLHTEERPVVGDDGLSLSRPTVRLSSRRASAREHAGIRSDGETGGHPVRARSSRRRGRGRARRRVAAAAVRSRAARPGSSVCSPRRRRS